MSSGILTVYVLGVGHEIPFGEWTGASAPWKDGLTKYVYGPVKQQM